MVPVSQLSACVTPEATLDQPVEHLRACHRRIEQRLEALERAAAGIGTQPDEARAVIAKSLRFLETNGTWHTEDEEQSLFPRLLAKIEPGDREFLRQLAEQHEKVEALVARLRETRLDDPEFSGAAADVAHAYREHIAFEEARLLDVAGAALSPAEIAEVAAEMKARRGL